MARRTRRIAVGAAPRHARTEAIERATRACLEADSVAWLLALAGSVDMVEVSE